MEAQKPARPVTDAPLYPYNPPQHRALSIVHMDEDLLVLSKPSGLLAVPGKLENFKDCLETRARKAFPEALLTHRLDRGTSGIMVMARNKRAQSQLGIHFEKRLIHKTYIARVWGHVTETQGTKSGFIDLPLRADWPNRPRQKICFERGKPSQTEWRVLEEGYFPPSLRATNGSEAIHVSDKMDCFVADAPRNDEKIPFTRIELKPLTGRSHQLRMHMLSLGHPILGDELYAHPEALNAVSRMQLHAQSITLHHPRDGRLVTFRDCACF